MNQLRRLSLLLILLTWACGPVPDDDDTAVDDDDSVADDDDLAVDDDDTAVDDDDSGDDDDSSDDDDSGTADDDDQTPVLVFSCGSVLTCEVDTEYCQIGYPGVRGADPEYSCEVLPAACLQSPDCTCISANLELPPGSFTCTSGPLGGDTVEVYYP